MRIYLASDHAGFELKEKVRFYLQEQGYEVEDCGAYTYDKNDDYPDFVVKAAREVAHSLGSSGIVFGASGTGECIVANKVKDVRAVLGWNHENVRRSKTHNNANVLSLGSIFIDFETAKELVKLFLETPFSGEERHKRRIEKIRNIDSR